MTEEEKTHIQKSASFGVELFHKLQRGEIDQAGFNKELAYWTLHEVFDTAEYIDLPSPISILQEYYDLSYEKRRKVKREFFDQPEVRAYLEKRDKIRAENNSTIQSLEELLKLLPKEDEANIERVSEKYKKFFQLRQRDELMFQPAFVKDKGTEISTPGKATEWEE